LNNAYKFIGIDEGKKNIFLAGTDENDFEWSLPLTDYPTARSLQKLDDKRFLVGYDKGYFVVDIASGAVLHNCADWEKITSVNQQKDGTTLLTGLDLEGMIGVCVLTLDKQDDIIKAVSRNGDYVRLMSVVSPNRYLLSTNDHIRETDRNLITKKKLTAEGFLHAWQSLRLDDGRTIVSSGYGAFMAVFSKTGKLVKRFGEKKKLPPEINPNFYASFQIAQDGNILVANWQGHGPDNGEKGRQLLCFSSEGDYLKSWSFPDKISSLQGLLLLPN
jgi:hypothetical protein